MSNVIYICPKDGTKHDDTTSHYCEACGGALRFYCVVHSDWLYGDVCPKCPAAPAPAPIPAPASAPIPQAPPAPQVAAMPPAPYTPSVKVAPPMVTISPKPAIGVAPPAPPLNFPGPRRSAYLSKLLAFFAIGIMALVILVMTALGLKSESASQLPPHNVVPAPQMPTMPQMPQMPTMPQIPPVPKVPPIPKMPSVPQPAPLKDEAVVFPNYAASETSIFEITQEAEPYYDKLVAITGLISAREAEKKSIDLAQGGRVIQVVYKRVSAAKQAEILNATDANSVKATGLIRRDNATNSYYLLARDIEIR